MADSTSVANAVGSFSVVPVISAVDKVSARWCKVAKNLTLKRDVELQSKLNFLRGRRELEQAAAPEGGHPWSSWVQVGVGGVPAPTPLDRGAASTSFDDVATEDSFVVQDASEQALACRQAAQVIPWFLVMPFRARRRWMILRRGVPVRVKCGAYAPWQTLYFKTGNEADDYAESMVMSGMWLQQDVDTAPTVVFDYTKVETWREAFYYRFWT